MAKSKPSWEGILLTLIKDVIESKTGRIIAVCILLLVGCAWLFRDQLFSRWKSRPVVEASGRVLTGAVHDADTHAPIPNLAVYTETRKGTTNELGQYELSLDSTNYQAGDRITVFTNNPEYGAAENTGTIGNNFHLDLAIRKNPSSTFAVGVVKDEKTGEAIQGIEIEAELEGDNLQTPSVRTDNFGRFRIPFEKSQLGSNKFVRLLLTDPGFHYATPVTGIPQNITSFITIPLQKRTSPTIHFRIAGFTRTIPLQPGDRIGIEAYGNMRLGEHIGTSDPDGRTSGLGGFPIGFWSRVKNLNHGCLLYRITGDQEWQFAGKKMHFTATHPGTLELQVNDNKQDDNSGAYEVDVTREP